MTIATEKVGQVTLVTLDRPDAGNAVTMEMAHQLEEAILSFDRDPDTRVLVVTGAGSKTFCAGGDVPSLLEVMDHTHIDRSGPLGFARLTTWKPTIAAVNGHCYGGGLELALWCDVRVASTNATFGALNRQWGVTLIDGATQRLPRIVGLGNALWMINTGNRVDAERAYQMGLVQELAPQGESLMRATRLAEEMASLPQPALRADRHATVASPGLTMEAGLNLEANVGRAVMQRPEVILRLEQERDRKRNK